MNWIEKTGNKLEISQKMRSFPGNLDEESSEGWNIKPCDIFKSKQACLHGGGGTQIGEVACGESPHLSCKHA